MALVDQNSLSATDAFQVRVMMALLNYVQGTVLAEAANEVQSVAVTGGTPTSGAFVLSGGPLLSQLTVVFNETAASLQAKIQAQLDSGDTCFCSGGPLPGTAIAVTFTGDLENSPQNLMATSGSTMNAGTPGNTRTTPGVAALRHAERLNLASRVLESPEKYKVRLAQAVTTDATVMSDYTGGGNNPASVTDAHIAAAVAAVYNSFLGA